MRYRVDASRSRFIAQAFAKGLLSAFGHNPRLAIRGFEGEAEFDHAAPNAASVWMKARADSLVVIDDMSERDRREIDRVTREFEIDAVALVEADELRAQGGFTLRLTDFNIRPISVAGGLLKLKDEVKLSFDILARASSE